MSRMPSCLHKEYQGSIVKGEWSGEQRVILIEERCKGCAMDDGRRRRRRPKTEWRPVDFTFQSSWPPSSHFRANPEILKIQGLAQPFCLAQFRLL